MAGFSRRLAAALLAAVLVSASPVTGQRAQRGEARVGGRIVRVAGGDTLAVPATAVVLHRVSPRAQGPIDTVPSDAGGRFAVRFRPDSGATYLVSVRWAGIEYFSAALSTERARLDTAVVIVVADTSSTAAVRVRQRTLLVGAPDESGFRPVLDWFALINESGLTRVAGDTARPVWAAPLPAGGEGADLADSPLSEFSPDAVLFRGDSVSLWAPISPGARELLVQYRLPPDRDAMSVPLGAGADSVQLLVEEPSARIRGGQLVAAEGQTIENRTFRRWSGPGRAGTTIDIAFPTPALSPSQIMAVLVAAAILAFAGLAVVLLRRGTAVARSPGPLALADAIARLDLEYAGREGEIPPDLWRRYQEQRAGLREELARALAGRRHRS